MTAGAREVHDEFPQYGFAGHKGYGTAAHLAALQARMVRACCTTGAVCARGAELACGGVPMISPSVVVIHSRDNAFVKDLRRLAQDSTAYASRVWLEGTIQRRWRQFT